MYRASETGILPPKELADAAKGMTPEVYAQEFECSFDAAITGAYFGKGIAEAERAGRICEVPTVPGVVVQTAWDLGIGDSTAIWVFQCIGNEIRVLDALENSGHGLEWYVEELDRRGWLRPDARHWLPHDAKVRELTTGRSRVEFLTSLHLKVDLVPNLGLEDGINGRALPSSFRSPQKIGCYKTWDKIRVAPEPADHPNEGHRLIFTKSELGG